MQRRSLVALMMSPLAGVTSIARAQSDTGKNKDGARPFRSVKVPGDSRNIFFFFDYACPFCAIYHEPFQNFVATAPKQIQTIFVPVVNTSDTHRFKEQVIAAKCHYAATLVASREQMRVFSRAVYNEYPNVGSLMEKRLWISALKASGINKQKFDEKLRDDGTNIFIKFAAKKKLDYTLETTPSVAVGGRYVITPNDVLGDKIMFFNILNGLTSEII